MAILSQVTVLGLTTIAVAQWLWIIGFVESLPVPRIIPAIVFLPFFPVLALPLMIPSLLIQWLRDEWHRFWNRLFVIELLLVVGPCALIFVWGMTRTILGY